MKKQSKLKVVFLSTILSVSLFSCGGSDNSPWLWSIDGQKYSANQLDEAYEGFLFMMSQSMQIPTEQLKKFIANPELVPDPQSRQMLRGINKEAYTENYKRMILMNNEAQKSGFSDEKSTQAKIKFIGQYYIANLYMMEMMKAKKVDVSEARALERWEMMRKQNPQYAKVPIEKGLEAASQMIQREELGKQQQELVKNILESYKIESNPDFTLVDYLHWDEKKGKEKKEAKTEPKTDSESTDAKADAAETKESPEGK